jgi:hypothetical protein
MNCVQTVNDASGYVEALEFGRSKLLLISLMSLPHRVYYIYIYNIYIYPDTKCPAQSKACFGFGHANAVVMGSNHTR